jgi:hypothetical protein
MSRTAQSALVYDQIGGSGTIFGRGVEQSWRGSTRFAAAIADIVGDDDDKWRQTGPTEAESLYRATSQLLRGIGVFVGAPVDAPMMYLEGIVRTTINPPKYSMRGAVEIDSFEQFKRTKRRWQEHYGSKAYQKFKSHRLRLKPLPGQSEADLARTKRRMLDWWVKAN